MSGVRERVPLAPLTSLGLGGPARWFLDATEPEEVREALARAAADGTPTVLLGGGSNVVVADEGVDALVVRLGLRGVSSRRDGDAVVVTAAAGEPWDPFVEAAVADRLAGVECLSGIPGTVGASPIQNVGAYGQEVSETVTEVRVLDLESFEERRLGPEECRFGYRDSRFRRNPGRFAVLGVTFRLLPGGEPAVRYPELERAVAETEGERGGPPGSPSLVAVRETVLALRRSKSMVFDPDDENRRSVGSFFVNPVLTAAEAELVVERAVAAGAAEGPEDVPRYQTDDGVKLPAAWLIEAAGFEKGTRRGPVGISSRHSLALVHHGGGTTADLVALAREVRDGVRERFGVTLRPEPIFLGFGGGDPLG